jgi:hypothetical protein
MKGLYVVTWLPRSPQAHNWSGVSGAPARQARGQVGCVLGFAEQPCVPRVGEVIALITQASQVGLQMGELRPRKQR